MKIKLLKEEFNRENSLKALENVKNKYQEFKDSLYTLDFYTYDRYPYLNAFINNLEDDFQVKLLTELDDIEEEIIK